LAKKAKEVKTFDDASFLAFTQHNLVAKRFERLRLENAVEHAETGYAAGVAGSRADTGTRLALRLRMYDLDKAKAALEHKERLANWEVDDMLYRARTFLLLPGKTMTKARAVRPTEDPLKNAYFGPSNEFELREMLALARAAGDVGSCATWPRAASISP